MGGSSFSELDLSHHGHLGIGDRGHAAAQNSRTPPNCARCRNHDVILPLKGHKRYCKYIDCKCEKCLLTAERQKVMARQTAIRRAEEQDRQREQKGLPVPGKGITPPLRSPAAAAAPCHPDLDHGNSSQRRSPSPDIVVTAAASPAASRRPPSPRRQHSNNAVKSGKEIWETIHLLMRWCCLPINSSPLIYIILSEITSDVSSVYKRIIEGIFSTLQNKNDVIKD